MVLLLFSPLLHGVDKDKFAFWAIFVWKNSVITDTFLFDLCESVQAAEMNDPVTCWLRTEWMYAGFMKLTNICGNRHGKQM